MARPLSLRRCSHACAPEGGGSLRCKHAHHDVDLDTPGKDTWRHRQAGAHETLLATGRRWALLHELRGAPEPSLAALLALYNRSI